MKKRLSLLVAVLMLFSLVPANAFAESTSHSSTVYVNNSEESKVPFSTTIELKTSDRINMNRYFDNLKNFESGSTTTRGTIHVRLDGQNVDFTPIKDGSDRIIGRDVNVKLVFEVMETSGKVKRSFDFSDGTNYENTISRYIERRADKTIVVQQPSNMTNANFLAIKNQLTIDNLVEISIAGFADFKYAADGDYNVWYDLDRVGLGNHKHKFAVVKDDGGLFLNRLVDIKPIGRGTLREASSFQVKGTQGDYVVLRLPSDDFTWSVPAFNADGMVLESEKNREGVTTLFGAKFVSNYTYNPRNIISWHYRATTVAKTKADAKAQFLAMTEFFNKFSAATEYVDYRIVPVRDEDGKIVSGKWQLEEAIYDYKGEKDLYELYNAKKGRDLIIELTSNKAIVNPFINVSKDAPKGEVELEAIKYPRGDKDARRITDRLVIADYVDYGIKLELLKPLQEVLANGETYRVDVRVSTTDRDLLTRYIDFESEGADVKIVNHNGNIKGADGKAYDGDFTSEFTWEYPTNRTADSVASNLHYSRENKFTMRLDVAPDWDSNGEVVLKAKPRGMEPVSLTILKVKPVAKMEVEMKEVLGGDSKVAVSDIVITETQGRALKSGEVFGITLKGLKFEDAKFDSKGKIEAKGIDVKGYTLDKDSQTLYFTINSLSKKDAPATITLKDLEVVSSRALPFGTHKLTFVHVGEFNSEPMKKGVKYAYTSTKHAALATINDAEFIKVVDKMSKVKKTTVFTLGSADYTVEGQAMKLDTPVFTQDNYTMLPVRAIADALGVEVVWNQENLTATFIDGDIVVSVTQNAKTLYKNGNSYPMVTKATVKADRMFIPVSSVGDAFGLTRGYDYLYDTTSKKVTIYPKLEAAKEVAVEKTEKVEETKPAK